MTLPLAVALDGAGWHPAAWREQNARPRDLFTARYWADLVRTAEDGGIDLVTIEDSLGLQSSAFGRPDDRVDQVRGRLDASLIASFVAPLTNRIGLVPTITTTHPEPFHVATTVQTLDYASRGRAGWRAQVSGSPFEAKHFGRREFPEFTIESLRGPAGEAVLRELFDEAADAIEVVRRLWDSWEDDAIIRDAATGRFIDREKLHYIDFAGERFSVKGPSITPRSPQGQPLVAVLAHQTIPYELAARGADIVFGTPFDEAGARGILGEIRDAESRVGRTGRPLEAWADVVVVLEETTAAARAVLDRLDERAGAPLASDALVFAGTPADLVDLLESWRAVGYTGFRLRPARLPDDLRQIVEHVRPRVAAPADAPTLRERLGFEPAANRYTDTEENAA
ncbi:LLM class flavin-dependent oxidoreductase [Agromyces atrinae]|uniref:Alkanesulfonate monooxygenase SsuD/methylene tetrahydromethanopterin reductase-like flavin-dependent oxidoreductase (Luciferase family) n=1 Tax=Agromyces atrinae TaxID=592376 RepID=A0A4Q2M4T7_9MICO|nr:LLM class flavin-dependent oxidoreductase [Agromyces atrinae]NYD67301.1 alkanesulfonate monooxygenase SsuD/methylene tetrahydromethanopterin reductase-like flavin-dependent oxidoreductase (luciferase family) [Agromyces atrinae]RXZ86868.1 LLM class flavin-dependent oxidoreductase [Agromyces atrinae]